ncbi:MAG: glutaminyl-peptide cyclotransferase [Pseudomonadota bacterium]
MRTLLPLPLLGLLACLLAPLSTLACQEPEPTMPQAPQRNAPVEPVPDKPAMFGYKVVATYPHSTRDFTQGLFFADGKLYETTGHVGQSMLIRHGTLGRDTATRVPLPAHVFGEGAVAVGERILSLTWRDGVGHVHDLNTMALVDEFPLAGEGWGLTYDGSRLIVSDGTNRLRFLDPDTYKSMGEKHVYVGSRPLPRINELEWIEGELWANIWQTDVLARIDVTTGQVTGFANLSGLFPDNPDRTNNVLNGIAYDPDTKKLFVTGKRWPTLFEVQLTPAR